MMILSMRATFGKLDHQTLTLDPGLNVIEAPNEWGKSTWCAFLVAMFYGIDTKSKSTKAQLADKEHYAPWSGAPMEGSMDLIWKGRKITIQRSTKGRIPMGSFRAFETDSGLDVPELTADNCGQKLLGVEKEVFTRSAFLRFTDLPVSDHEQLRSRLNALVTTGDESGSAQLLEQKLKDLKNRCRHNKSGLLPQAQQQKEQIQSSIQQQQTLSQQEQMLRQRAQELEEYIDQLNNHKAALRHKNAAQANAQLQELIAERDQAAKELEAMEARCRSLPDREVAFKNVQELTQLRQKLDAMELEERMIPRTQSMPEPPMGFEDCNPKAAILQAKSHISDLQELEPKRSVLFYIFIAIAMGALGCAYDLFRRGRPLWSLAAALFAVVALVPVGLSIIIRKRKRSQYRSLLIKLSHRYGNSDPEQWLSDAVDFARAWDDYVEQEYARQQMRGDLDDRRENTILQGMEISGSKGITASLTKWNNILSMWDACADARRQLHQKEKQLETLRSMLSPVPAPDHPSTLTFNEAETNRLLSDANQELRKVLARMGQYQGQAEALGSSEALQEQQEKMDIKIQQLEKTYQALEFAQTALKEATEQLQRRFAPRISESTQELFHKLTGGRYDRLQITQDLTLQFSAQDENVLRSHHWRSDGTVDQLYLALRLAVARELTPESPMVLDDALIRFDDTRLQLALQVLEEESKKRQILIFTCQKREKQFLKLGQII